MYASRDGAAVLSRDACRSLARGGTARRRAGRRLFVWAKRARCCHGTITYLETSSEPGERPFRRVYSDEIQLYLDARLAEPEELVIEASGRRRKHVHAYWNGCAYVI